MMALNSHNYLRSSKPFWNVLAITYTLSGYYAGIGLLISTSLSLNTLGIVLVTHTLVLSAYLAHEFTHGTIFRMLLTFYHRYRLKRIFLGEGEAVNDRGKLDMSKFYGALGGTAILLPARLID